MISRSSGSSLISELISIYTQRRVARDGKSMSVKDVFLEECNDEVFHYSKANPKKNLTSIKKKCKNFAEKLARFKKKQYFCALK